MVINICAPPPAHYPTPPHSPGYFIFINKLFYFQSGVPDLIISCEVHNPGHMSRLTCMPTTGSLMIFPAPWLVTLAALEFLIEALNLNTLQENAHHVTIGENAGSAIQCGANINMVSYWGGTCCRQSDLSEECESLAWAGHCGDEQEKGESKRRWRKSSTQLIRLHAPADLLQSADFESLQSDVENNGT